MKEEYGYCFWEFVLSMFFCDMYRCVKCGRTKYEWKNPKAGSMK